MTKKTTKIVCDNLDGLCIYKHVLEIGKIYYERGIYHDDNVEYYYLDNKENGDICGYFDISMFISIAEYREKQINSILDE